MTRNVNWNRVPEHIRGGLKRYIENGIQPGHALTAVLSNDLRGACERADEEVRHRLFDIVSFLYCYAPSGCWGSPENVSEWCKQGGLKNCIHEYSFDLEEAAA